MSAGRWLAWQPETRILANAAEREPTKPSQPGSVGFEGANSEESPKIEAHPADIAHASDLLNRRGVRIMKLADEVIIGVWSDLDGPEIRAALRVLEMDHQPVRYLDGAGIPNGYKTRQVAGEPVPLDVLAEMEADPEQPWLVRDRLSKQGEKSK